MDLFCCYFGVNLVLFAPLGALIGRQKNAVTEGFLLGLLLSAIGVIIAFLIDQRAMCGRCGGRLNGTPSVCPHCHAAVAHGASRPAARPEALAQPFFPATGEGPRSWCAVCQGKLDGGAICPHCGAPA